MAVAIFLFVMKFKLSTFQSVGDTRPEQIECTWAQFTARCAAPRVRSEKDGLLFSPAIYRGCRRLQRDVIELSMLVLEVDGAWACDQCGYKAPLVLFRNARHEGDRCPECKRRDKKLETSTITQIHFELADVVADVRGGMQSAFAIYSSHSHNRVTINAAIAEPRFRIVVPLAEPIPVAWFRELWNWAAAAMQTIPIDPQDKDPNRPWYTPVKSSEEAIYEFHIEPGEFLDWKKVISGQWPVASEEVRTGSGSDRASVDGFTTHEERHDEFVSRIMARGKLNSQGNYDAKCLAHGGRGNTAVAYFPHTGAVKCNRGCDYYDLLFAEGLSNNPLPSRERLAAVGSGQWAASRETAPATDAGSVGSAPPTAHCPLPTVSAAKLHAVYSLLLAHFFVLTAKDETAIRRDWKLNPYGSEIVELPAGSAGILPASSELPTAHCPLPTVIKHCSMPSLIEQMTACRELLRLGFDLRGIPGFYLAGASEVPAEPSRASAVDRWAADEFGPWRLNLPYRKGVLVGYTNGTGYLLGIKIYRSTKDGNPLLLTSRGLPSGARAVALKESEAA